MAELAKDETEGREGISECVAAPSRKAQALEVAVFLFLIVPSLGLSLFVVRQIQLTFVFVAVSTMLRDLSLVCLVFYFLWRNGERISTLGWKSANAKEDFVLGIALFLPFSYTVALLQNVLGQMGLSSPEHTRPAFLVVEGAGEYALGFILVVVVAFSEETIFRGYLILRFKALAGTAAAVLLSSAIFSLGHGYEGSAGVVTVGFIGVIFALVYLWRGSLVAPSVMHFLQNFAGIFILPLLEKTPS